MKITGIEIRQLENAAKLAEQEALTWQDGFAAFDGERWTWPSREYDWAHIRYLKLKSSASFLRALAKRARKS